MKKIAAISLCLVMCAGCHNEVKVEEIVGSYTYKGKGFEQRLTMYAGGSYETLVLANGAIIWSSKNGWTYLAPNVTFRNFHLGASKPTDRQSYSEFEIERSFLTGKPVFCVDPEDAYGCFFFDGR